VLAAAEAAGAVSDAREKWVGVVCRCGVVLTGSVKVGSSPVVPSTAPARLPVVVAALGESPLATGVVLVRFGVVLSAVGVGVSAVVAFVVVATVAVAGDAFWLVLCPWPWR